MRVLAHEKDIEYCRGFRKSVGGMNHLRRDGAEKLMRGAADVDARGYAEK